MSERIATIANDGNLSGAVDISQGILTGLHIPENWTAAVVTFQVQATEGAPFGNLRNELNAERSLTVTADSFTQIDPPIVAHRVKVRSGTAGSPVTQTGERTIELAVLF